MKKTITLYSYALFFCLFPLALAAQQKKYPSTLLWRITGPWLSTPSYLYGTIHMTDRRLFYFSDSLYRCLEKAEGFAMEINPDTALNSLFLSLFSNNNPVQHDTLSSAAFIAGAKQLENESGVPAGKITQKQLWLYSYKAGQEKKEGDMDSPVDTYLYNIAKRQGKKVGGIEDLADQLGLLKEMRTAVDADPLLYKSGNQLKMEELKAIYVNQDLDRLEAFMLDVDTVFRDHLLYRRNKKMAFRIDSMARVRSYLFAVGAAHLPGEKGLIALLHARGYKVEPIFSTQKIAPEAYHYKAIELPWPTLHDEGNGYTVQIPGKPLPIKSPAGDIVQLYEDFGTSIVYYTMMVHYPSVTNNTDSLELSMAKKIAGGRVERTDTVTCNGIRGVELRTAMIGKYFYRIRAFLKGHNMYVLMTSLKTETPLGKADNDRFFNSLIMTAAKD